MNDTAKIALQLYSINKYTGGAGLAKTLAEGCILVTHDDDIAKYGAFVRKV